MGDKYNGSLMYFLPYAHDQDEKNPKMRFPVNINVEGYSQRILHFARFGAYDEENARFVFSLNIKGESGHCKKVVVVDRQGHLDKSFGSNKTGIQNVPSDVGQLAGICPVISNKKFHGYIMLDALGNKVMHMNKYGHISKVIVCDEKGNRVSETSKFGRPASICSNGRSYVIGYHYGGEGVSCVKMYTPVDT